MMIRAIFLGSFNPPHKGHVNCIQSVVDSGIMKELNIDKIHVIPCWQNPNKNKFTVPFIKRYQMVCYMFGDLIRNGIVCPDDIEEILQKTDCQFQYTYQLINYFNNGHDEFIKKGFWWIITEETYEELLQNKWKESKNLLDNNRFIIVYNKLRTDWLHISYDKAMKEHRIVHIPLIDNVVIHSTDIRNNFWVNTKYDNYITKELKDYIIENNLYKE